MPDRNRVPDAPLQQPSFGDRSVIQSDALSSTPPDAEHLSDEEIDQYSAGLLAQERVRPFEEHYLDCRECLSRVDQVEALVTGLRALPERRPFRFSSVLRAAAAGLAGLALGWQLHALRGPVEDIGAPPAGAGPRAVASGDAATGLTWARFDLGPLVRDAARIQTIQPPPNATHLLLSIDGREAGGPGGAFDVGLIDDQGRTLAFFHGVPSAANGLVSVAVPAALLKPGDYVAEMRHQSAILEIPFRVEPAAAEP